MGGDLEEEVTSFFQKYRNHRGFSKKCGLDERYFWKVLKDYPGLVKSEMRIEILHDEFVDDEEMGPVQQFTISEIDFDTKPLGDTQGQSIPYRFIKLVISNNNEIHHNLIYIDSKEREVVRFEPLYDRYYTKPINTVLQEYFSKLVPSFRFRMLDDHPQSGIVTTCPSKGMENAHILRKAMTLVGKINTDDLSAKQEEFRILRFADAIEKEYSSNGEFGPFDNFFTPSKWSRRTKNTAGAGAIGAGAGFLLGGWQGALIGGGAAAVGGYLLSKKDSSEPPKRYDY